MWFFCTFVSRIRRIGINLGQNRLGRRKFQFGYGRPNDYNFDYGLGELMLFSGTYKQLPEISERNWWFLIARDCKPAPLGFATLKLCSSATHPRSYRSINSASS